MPPADALSSPKDWVTKPQILTGDECVRPEAIDTRVRGPVHYQNGSLHPIVSNECPWTHELYAFLGGTASAF